VRDDTFHDETRHEHEHEPGLDCDAKSPTAIHLDSCTSWTIKVCYGLRMRVESGLNTKHCLA
jgi:hypothetical protein